VGVSLFCSEVEILSDSSSLSFIDVEVDVLRDNSSLKLVETEALSMMFSLSLRDNDSLSELSSTFVKLPELVVVLSIDVVESVKIVEF